MWYSCIRPLHDLQGLGTFGSFPDRFVNNTSKRCRSAYLTDSKTHALSNAQFDEIVRYPGKAQGGICWSVRMMYLHLLA